MASETRIIGLNSYVTAYAYDAADHVTQMVLPSGRIVSYSYNSIGEIASVTMKKDAAAASENVAIAITWRPMTGVANGFTYGNGLVFSRTLGQMFQTTALKVKDGATDIISKSYAYDGNFNVKAIDDLVTPANDVDLTYTPANRLDTATGPWGSLDYAYDAVGNRTQEVKIQSDCSR